MCFPRTRQSSRPVITSAGDLPKVGGDSALAIGMSLRRTVRALPRPRVRETHSAGRSRGERLFRDSLAERGLDVAALDEATIRVERLPYGDDPRKWSLDLDSRDEESIRFIPDGDATERWFWRFSVHRSVISTHGAFRPFHCHTPSS